MKNSLQVIQKTIEKYNMLSKADTILVAFSGGYDSVCLALALHKIGYTIGLAHVHHGLRESAGKDAEFCAEFAKRLDVPFYLKMADVNAYAKEHGLSTETAGRQIRYEFFEQIEGYTKIATAHHKNDCAETVLLHLIRGSGLKGLSGIAPMRGKIIRPLIELSRTEIEHFVQQCNITPCTDETNFSKDYARNRVRLEILPALVRENPKSVDNICKTAALLREDEAYLYAQASSYVQENKISIDVLKTLPFPIASRAVRLAYAHAAGTAKDLELKHVAYILSHLKNHGNILNLCLGLTAVARYGTLIFQKNAQTEQKGFCYPLNIGGVTAVPECSLRIHAEISDTPPESGIYFDYEKLESQPLFIRSRKPKDFFIPFGMQGGKSIKKLFIDLKIPLEEREKTPLLATDREILWIVGKKRSALYKADIQTKKFFKLWREIVHESGYPGNTLNRGTNCTEGCGNRKKD